MGKTLIIVVCVFLIVACGRSSGSGTTAAQSQAGQASVVASSPAAVVPVSAPGCGTYCQQAGNSAGNLVDGYPCPSSGCLNCPPGNCVTLQSSGATAANGVLTVRMSCNLSAECRGAFLVCLPLAFCQAGATQQAAGGRLAGSDFAVPAGTTSDVPVALTDLGKQVASGPGGYMASVLVDMQDYGYVTSNDTTISLATTDPPAYPPGATASCGGTVFVGPDTSCPFAENVASAYMEAGNSGNLTVTAVSPAANQAYTMQCADGSPVSCTGGTNAVVEFYS